MTFLEVSELNMFNKTDLEIINNPLVFQNLLLEPYESVVNEFKCQKCEQLVYKKEIYQCKNGDPLCKKCFQEQIESSHQCHVCKVPISSIEELSKCKFYENSFSNKKIRCPWSLKSNYSISEGEKILSADSGGCTQVIKISELQDHILNCEKRFVLCESTGCDQVLRYQNLKDHIEECDYTIINCQHCSIEIMRFKLELHYSECPSIEIECHQCHIYVKRGSLFDHIRINCDNTKIPCKYSNYGCNAEFERKQLNQHLESVNHIKYVTNLIEKQQEEIQLLKSSNSSLNSIVNDLKANEQKQKNQMDHFIQIMSTLDLKKVNENQNIYNGYWFLNDYSNNIVFNSPIYKLGEIDFSFTAYNHNFSILNNSTMNFIVKFTIVNSKYENNKKLMKEREYKKGFKSYFLFPFLKSSYSSDNGFINEDKLTIKFQVHFYDENSKVLLK